MDLIVSFPQDDTVFIGFFIMYNKESGKGKGTFIIDEALTALRQEGFKKARLVYMKGNPQSKAFLEKSGFIEIDIIERNRATVVVLEKTL